MSKQRVVILGASDNPERYSHRALLLLNTGQL
jgi:predicted CoA-binding protein